jgi:hypothetical protein
LSPLDIRKSGAPPVSTTPAANFATGFASVVDHGKFATGVYDTGGNLTPVSTTPVQWCTLSCELLCEFSKKIETAILVYSGAWGKLIHEKNQK